MDDWNSTHGGAIQLAEFFGTAGNDSIVGTGDNDVLHFSFGNDTLRGGAGIDLLNSGEGGDTFPEGTILDLELGTLVADGLSQTLIDIENVYGGGGGNVTLRGTDADNFLGLFSGDGTSILEGRGGDDILSLQEGVDGSIFGGTGDDILEIVLFTTLPVFVTATVEGGEGTDRLFINADIEDFQTDFNSSGQVVLNWTRGQVTLLDEVEFFNFSNTGDIAYDDFIVSPIEGTDTGEVLTGTSGKDFVNALGGNDWILASTGADVTDGGDGTDMISFVGQDRVIVNLGTGRVELGNALAGPTEIQHVSNVENITGTSKSDHLGGDEGANYIRGLGGADILIGSAGGDLLDGGAGNDVLAPNDFVPDVDSNISLLRGRIWEGEGAGSRLVSIENIISGSGNDRLTGDHATNRLVGGDGNDILMGNGGNDLVYGGRGTDIAIFSFDQDQYSVTTSNNGVTEVAYTGTGTGDGTDLLTGIETLRFADGDLIL